MLLVLWPAVAFAQVFSDFTGTSNLVCGTANAVPKVDAAGLLDCSTVTDDGATVTTGNPLVVGVGANIPALGTNVSLFGVVGNGTTDDTAAMQAALNSVQPSGGRLVLSCGKTYKITSTLTVTQAFGVTVIGCTGSGYTIGNRPVFKWLGAANGTVLKLSETRDSIFEGFVIQQSTNIGVAIDIDAPASGVVNVPTHNTFRRVYVDQVSGTPGTCIRIANTSTENNENHIFEDVDCGGGTIGYAILNGQAKEQQIVRGSVSSMTTAGIQIGDGSHTGGSFTATGGTNFSSNAVDVLLTNPGDRIALYGCDSESAGRFIDQPTNTGAFTPIIVMGCRAAPQNVVGDGKYIRVAGRGPVTLIGNDLSGGAHLAGVTIQLGSSAPYGAVVQNNVFSNIAALPTSGHGTSLWSMGNSYVDAGGLQQPFPSYLGNYGISGADPFDKFGVDGVTTLTFRGATSGSLGLTVPAVAGTNTLTLPAGTTDFSGTGGTSQVVKQTTSGGAFTVAQLAASDLSNGTTGSGAVCLATSPALVTPTLGVAAGTSMILGSPTGGDQGSGTLNIATGYYTNGTAGLTTTFDVLCDATDPTKKRTITVTGGLVTDKGTCA